MMNVVKAIKEFHHSNVMDARLAVVPDGQVKQMLVHLRSSQAMVLALEKERIQLEKLAKKEAKLREKMKKKGKKVRIKKKKRKTKEKPPLPHPLDVFDTAGQSFQETLISKAGKGAGFSAVPKINPNFEYNVARLFADFLGNDDRLRVVNLSECSLVPEETPILANAIAEHPHIVAVSLADNYICRRTRGGSERIDVSPLFALCEHLIRAPKLKHLDLSGNPMGERGALVISHMLMRSPTITTLGVDRCELGTEAKRILGRALLYDDAKKLPGAQMTTLTWREQTRYVNVDQSGPSNDERQSQVGKGKQEQATPGAEAGDAEKGAGAASEDEVVDFMSLSTLDDEGTVDGINEGTVDGINEGMVDGIKVRPAAPEDEDADGAPPPPDGDDIPPPPPAPGSPTSAASSSGSSSDSASVSVLQFLRVDEWDIEEEETTIELARTTTSIEDVTLLCGVLRRNKSIELLDLSFNPICGRTLKQQRRWQRTQAAQRWQWWDMSDTAGSTAIGSGDEQTASGGDDTLDEDAGEGGATDEGATDEGATDEGATAGRAEPKKKSFWGSKAQQVHVGGDEGASSGVSGSGGQLRASPRKKSMLDRAMEGGAMASTLAQTTIANAKAGYQLGPSLPWWEVQQLQQYRLEPLKYAIQQEDWDDWHAKRYGQGFTEPEPVIADPESLIVSGARIKVRSGAAVGKEGVVLNRVGQRVRIRVDVEGAKPLWKELHELDPVIKNDESDDDDTLDIYDDEGFLAWQLQANDAEAVEGQAHWMHEYETTAVEAIGRMLRFNNTLLVLNLANIGLVQRKHADHNHSCWDGVRLLCEGVSHNQSLTLLDISFNGLGGDRRENMEGVHSSDDDDGAEPGCTGAQILASAIDANHSIRHLDLAGNDLSLYSEQEEGLVFLAAAIGGSNSITSLNLASNCIKAKGLDAISGVLQRNSNLAALNLCANRIGHILQTSTIRTFADTIENSRTLHSIDLRGNDLQLAQECVVIIDALENNVGGLVGFNGHHFKEPLLLRQNVHAVLDGWYEPPPETESESEEDEGPSEEEVARLQAIADKKEALKMNEICGVCKNQFDPAKHGVPLGAPFSKLPSSWKCPNCNSPKVAYVKPPKETKKKK
jgi:Ran GTPase-activating protein (RanGAP) involved in mRNA processing and transport/rubredoxin